MMPHWEIESQPLKITTEALYPLDPLMKTGRPERSVRERNAPFLRSRSTNSPQLYIQRNASAILKKFEELAYESHNQAFKLENSAREMTGLAGQF